MSSEGEIRFGTCLKASILTLNVVTGLGSLVVVVIGMLMLTVRSFSSALLTNKMYITSVGLIVAMGFAMVALSILGSVVTAKELKWMLLTCYILVLIIFVVMLVGGIVQLVLSDKLLRSLQRDMSASIKYYGYQHKYTRAWDDMHTYLQCCGMHDYKDWGNGAPDSCCKRSNCQSSPSPTTMHMEGCLLKVNDLLRKDALNLGAGAIIVAVFMLPAIILSYALFVKIE